MSAAKYAGLPDIDTSQDVYETPDTLPTSQVDGHSSEEEEGIASRGTRGRGNNADVVASQEELIPDSLLPTDVATRKFRNAERKREHRPRLVYTYPPSPASDEENPATRPPPLSQRLRLIQQEIASLESELSDPSNPFLHDDNGDMADPGSLMKGLLDVRGRLEKVTKTKMGRGELVERVIQAGESGPVAKVAFDHVEEKTVHDEKAPDLSAMDKRLGDLETMIGSSNTTLDETSPLPPPLLPLITRLSNQMTLLTQPRHIDSISRRLKLLLSDLERVSSAHIAFQNRRQSGPSPDAPVSSLQETIQPVLTRLTPLLPHIPHILERLRTLSALHTSAASFQHTLQTMEEEQKRVRSVLEELEKAVQAVETGLEDNGKVITLNIAGLDTRVEGLNKRLVNLGK